MMHTIINWHVSLSLPLSRWMGERMPLAAASAPIQVLGQLMSASGGRREEGINI